MVLAREPLGVSGVCVPTFEVKVARAPLREPIARRITRVSVTESHEPPNEFSLQLFDPELKLVGLLTGPFVEGAEIEIGLGYVGAVRTMFNGRITAVTAHFPESGAPVVDVQGTDDLHKLTRGTAYRRFDDAERDSNIVTKIAGELKLQADVDPTPPRKRPRVQMNQSNYAFLQDLAALNGYAVWVEGNTLFFKKARPTRDSLQLEWGRTLQSFTPRISTAGLVKRVVVKGYDPVQKQGFTGRAEGPSTLPVGLSPDGLRDVQSGSGDRSELVLEDAPVSSEVEARAYAQAILDQIWQGAVTGSGTSPGQAEMRVGSLLALSGIGRFSADYIVTKVTHSVGEGGYQTSFEVNGGTSFTGRDPTAAGGGGLAGSGLSGRAGGAGLIIGIVEENKDPEGLARVRVRLPGVTDEQIAHWARVASPMAGPERGIFFLPEKQDEVLVALEHGDPARPYVLGALWNGRDRPPKANTECENNLRLIKTRSGHILRFDDKDGSERIELIDASGNSSLVIDTAAETVTITSAKDVVIQAENGTIRLQAKAVEVTATGEARIGGDSGLTLESSGGNTVIKGTKVNIN